MRGVVRSAVVRHDAYTEHIRRDSTALREAAAAADTAATIDACPSWTPVDLVWHIGEVHEFWGRVVIDRPTERPTGEEPDRPASESDVYAVAEAWAQRLVDALSETDPATPVWTWSDDHSVGFVARRMAQETAVHRWDAERAAGNDHRIDAELAADGIDEFLYRHLEWVDPQGRPFGYSVHLHCTDVEGEWIVRPGADDQPAVTTEHAKGDAALRGTASDLLLVLWRRAPLSSVDVVGDAAVAERFVALSDLD